MGRIAADLGCSSFREEPKVRRLFAGGRRIRTLGPASGNAFRDCPFELAFPMGSERTAASNLYSSTAEYG
jgi:hypothetical protein